MNRFWWGFIALRLLHWWWMLRRIDPALRWWLDLEERLRRAAELTGEPFATIFRDAASQAEAHAELVELQARAREERANGRAPDGDHG